MGFSFILIFPVVAAQFESFRAPFIILFGSVPLDLSGVLLFSFLGLTTINIDSQVGLITLVGQDHSTTGMLRQSKPDEGAETKFSTITFTMPVRPCR
jgi:Cu/Ag efflux pump CusA